jgi:hypothetical protein
MKTYFDKSMKVTRWPKKSADKLDVLQYLITKFDLEKHYSEKEINLILDDWHVFEDHVLLRRALVDQGFMDRKEDGSEYWVNTERQIESPYVVTC